MTSLRIHEMPLLNDQDLVSILGIDIRRESNKIRDAGLEFLHLVEREGGVAVVNS